MLNNMDWTTYSVIIVLDTTVPMGVIISVLLSRPDNYHPCE